MKRLLRAVAVSGALGVLLAGCSGDEPRPKMAPTTSASPTPSVPPSLDPTPTVVPTAPVLGPEETVRAWVEARNEAMKTGDVAAVTALTAGDCSSCQDLITPIVETYERGGRYETAGWSVLRSQKEMGPSGASVTAALRLAGGTTYDSADAAPVRYPAEQRIAVFELKQRDHAWTVSLIGFLR